MERHSTWTPAAGTYLRLFQTIIENSLVWRPKRLVTLLHLQALQKLISSSIYLCIYLSIYNDNSDSGTAIIFKTAVLVWKCIHGVAAVYLQELCTQVDSIRGRPRLRSASTGCIQLPGVQTSVVSFASYNGPAVWNSLPVTLRDSSVSLHTFKRRLKTYLFAA